MTLLYAALAYMLGLCPLVVAICRYAVPPGGRTMADPACTLAVRSAAQPTGPAPALFAGIALCLLTGLLRYGSNPFTSCWTPADLAYYGLPPDAVYGE